MNTKITMEQLLRQKAAHVPKNEEEHYGRLIALDYYGNEVSPKDEIGIESINFSSGEIVCINKTDNNIVILYWNKQNNEISGNWKFKVELDKENNTKQKITKGKVLVFIGQYVNMAKIGDGIYSKDIPSIYPIDYTIDKLISPLKDLIDNGVKVEFAENAIENIHKCELIDANIIIDKFY